MHNQQQYKNSVSLPKRILRDRSKALSAMQQHNISNHNLQHNNMSNQQPKPSNTSPSNQIMQMPQLALHCAQFFHSLSAYCLTYYKNHNRDEINKKNKLIKKANHESKKKPRKHAQNDGNQDKNRLEIQHELPKKPLTAYIIYFQEKKPSFVHRYPNLNLSELTKLIAKEWKELTEEQRKPYLERASDDRKRYDQEMNQFKKKYGQWQNQNELIDAQQNAELIDEPDIKKEQVIPRKIKQNQRINQDNNQENNLQKSQEDNQGISQQKDED